MRPIRHVRALAATASLGVALVAALTPAQAAAPGNAYIQKNLVSDQPGMAQVTDSNLVNPWGLSASPSSPIWVANNHTATSTLYRSHPTAIVPLVVNIAGGGSVTGTVFNGTGQFMVSAGGATATAPFLFASESGEITGWNPTVPPPPTGATSTSTEIAASTPGASYKGLALAMGGSGQPYLYAANFAQGRIDVWDGTFAPVHLAGGFMDDQIPAGYAPFNVQALEGMLYVAYAQVGDDGDEVAGHGKGFVDVYTPEGALVKRLVMRGALNAPWGLAISPNGWGLFQDSLLVGNFGDGYIHAYNKRTGAFLGTLKRPDGSKVWIDGLWALMFGNGTIGSKQTLLFTAGTAGETHGLFGALRPQR